VGRAINRRGRSRWRSVSEVSVDSGPTGRIGVSARENSKRIRQPQARRCGRISYGREHKNSQD